MNFRCSSCDAVMVFDPEKQDMLCPYCDSIGNERLSGDDSMTVCPSCGGELDPGQYLSASKCPYCSNFIIFNPRVTGDYKPHTILPFKIGKDHAVKLMEEEFKSRIFTPLDFLSKKTLKNMDGYYVPFFMYDYDVDSEYVGEGSTSRSWREGNYRYTETSHYMLHRHLKAAYDDVPADASKQMPDSLMDLAEPYDYQMLTEFDPKYLSGFYSEIYNFGPDELEPRAREKVLQSCRSFMKGSLTGFSLSAPQVDRLDTFYKNASFSLLPIWRYTYIHNSLPYTFYVNGQSGKVIGNTPVSRLKVLVYAIGCAGLWTLLLSMLAGIIGL